MVSNISRNYLNRQFLWAGLGFLAALTLMFLACWHSVSRFMATSQYEAMFSRLLAESVRLETELTLILARDSEPGARDIARLRSAYRNLAGLNWTLREASNSQVAADAQSYEALLKRALGSDTALDDVLYVDGRYTSLPSGHTPKSLLEIWKGTSDGGKAQRGLEPTIMNILRQVAPIVEVEAQKTELREAQMMRVLNQEFPFVRPILRELSQRLAQEAGRTKRQLIAFLIGLVAIGAAAGIFIWRGIFFPLTKTILDAQLSLKEERDRALQAEQAKGDFLAVMSHELRTPMNAVIGFTNLLSQSNLNSQQKEFVDTILGSSETLLSLLNDVLDFSKIEAGKIELEIEPFSVEDVAGNIIDLMGPTAYAKNLELLCFVEPKMPQRIMGDSSRLRQILFNLVGNAIKFTSTGSVTVEVHIKTIGDDDQPAYEISVTDTGIGITSEAQETIFDRFTQADNSTTRRFGGTGLGLAISKRLTEIMGGELTVESKVGKGSTFRALLPLEEAEPPTGTIIDQEPTDISDLKILIVDDNEQNRRVFSLILDSYGAETVWAEDAGEATSKLLAAERSGHPFDLAIIDHMMPDIDGCELAEMIRGIAAIQHHKLILSSSAHWPAPNGADKELFDGKCPKPIRQSALVTMVRDLANKPTIERKTALADAEVPKVSQSDEAPAKPAASETPKAANVAPADLNARPSEKNELEAEPPANSHDDQSSADEEASASDVVRVLLADDHVPNQRLICAYLGNGGYSIDTANDGVEAVQMARTLPYDVVLMDVNMPEMSGIEATERIRNAGTRNADTPIIAVTANVLPGDRDKYIASGMDDYITKPITLSDLKGALDRWIGQRHVNNDVGEAEQDVN